LGRKRLCVNFAWRDNDTAYRSNRENDRLVFRKIRVLILDGFSADRAIDALFKSEFWHDRMCNSTRSHPNGKTHASWKRCYYRFRAKIKGTPNSGDSVQAENYAFHPRVCELKRDPEKFYQESGVKYPPPRDERAVKRVSDEATPDPPHGTENTS